jgi:hypothetical protein
MMGTNFTFLFSFFLFLLQIWDQDHVTDDLLGLGPGIRCGDCGSGAAMMLTHAHRGRIHRISEPVDVRNHFYFFFAWQVLIRLALFLFKTFHVHVDADVTSPLRSHQMVPPHGGLVENDCAAVGRVDRVERMVGLETSINGFMPDGKKLVSGSLNLTHWDLGPLSWNAQRI